MMDNSKRMKQLQSILGDAKKTKKILSKARQRKRNPASESSLEKTERTERTERTTSERSIHATAPVLDFKCIISVQESWRQVASKELELGESILLEMIEINYACRQHMKITSFRSKHFQNLCHTLVQSLNEYIESLSPDMDPEEVVKVAANLIQNGISLSIMTQALPNCLHAALKISSIQQEYWDQVANHLRFHSGLP